MKLTLASLAVLALTTVGSVSGYSANLETLYGYVCDSHTQVENLSGSTSYSYLPYTDNSIFQFITGSYLGQQVERGVTDSTCFQQAYQTKEFMDTIADSAYTIAADTYSF